MKYSLGTAGEVAIAKLLIEEFGDWDIEDSLKLSIEEVHEEDQTVEVFVEFELFNKPRSFYMRVGDIYSEEPTFEVRLGDDVYESVSSHCYTVRYLWIVTLGGWD